MIRLLVVLAVIALFAVAKLAADRRRERQSVVAADEHLPVELRGARWVVFTTPTCATCGPVLAHLRAGDDAVTAVDATARTDLVDALGVRSAPTVLRADAAGRIELRLAGPRAATEFFSLATA